jgi:hypothetical protein
MIASEASSVCHHPVFGFILRSVETEEKIARLETRMEQLEQIAALLNRLRRMTGYAFQRVHEIRVLTETAVDAGKGEMVLALSEHHSARIKDMQDKAGPILRSCDSVTRKLEALCVNPTQLAYDLDDDRIDSRFERLMGHTLDKLQAYQTLLGSHIFDLDEMANELSGSLQNRS